jgi:hypothetical protein
MRVIATRGKRLRARLAPDARFATAAAVPAGDSLQWKQ